MDMIWNYTPPRIPVTSRIQQDYSIPINLHVWHFVTVTGWGAPTEVMIRFPLWNQGFYGIPYVIQLKVVHPKMLKKHSLEKIFLFWKYMLKKILSVSSKLLRDVKQVVFISFVKSHLNQSSPGFQNCWKIPPRGRKHHQHPQGPPQPSIPLGKKIILNLQHRPPTADSPPFSRWWLNHQPIWKIICASQIGSWNPRLVGDEHKKKELPPPRFLFDPAQKHPSFPYQSLPLKWYFQCLSLPKPLHLLHRQPQLRSSFPGNCHELDRRIFEVVRVLWRRVFFEERLFQKTKKRQHQHHYHWTSIGNINDYIIHLHHSVQHAACWYDHPKKSHHQQQQL